MKYICDSNFILRYLLADNPEMFSKTKEIFDQAKIGHITLVIEQAVFTEVIFVLSSFYKIPKDKITLTLSEMLTYKGVQSDKNHLLLALDYYLKYNLHIVDCILLAKAVTTDLPVLSFDQKLLDLVVKK
ncbi:MULTISPECIES: PIN domain-containing protein [unclassified Candidatus Tisiphia]|uniref:PIN domain-containing protein n=1 Tax=unclassified Candidatus Tisiphia TaxID=2996318 RepID=UPI00312C9CB7